MRDQKSIEGTDYETINELAYTQTAGTVSSWAKIEGKQSRICSFPGSTNILFQFSGVLQS